VGLLSFLRDVGKFARVGTMLSRDAVKSRMELDNEGISFTEWVQFCGCWTPLPHLCTRGLSQACDLSPLVLTHESSVCRFTYQLLQGYDFVHLNREHGVRMQVHIPVYKCCNEAGM
jgi:tyrosyl-tRNA synthetase